MFLNRGGILFALTGIMFGCSLAGSPRPVPPRPGPALPSAPPGRGAGREPSSNVDGVEIGTAVVEVAFEAIGAPYRWGGTSANGFDCSGLIRYAYGQFGIDLPRISRDQLRTGAEVGLSMGALKPGDVLGFSAVPGGEASHVGLYVGDGRFIHSSTSGVRVSNLAEPYWQRNFMAARRMVR